ncbi:MAG TPA: vWA domain-containing protein [Gaiellaceae bacterium]|nr:vWA domain-containing protein [Gaiellaceae bacterium]
MGVDFLTPLDALFALAAVVPLGALALARRRELEVRRAFRLSVPRARAVAPAALAVALLPALLGVAAAQPVVVRQRQVSQRADAQAYIVFDTSLSMAARHGPHAPSRLTRAKREALRLVASLGDIPVGIAAMTDRTLPNLLPTTDLGLVDRTIRQSVGIDRPPPSLRYPDRATTLRALVPMGTARFYSTGVTHRILVVFTDGESAGPLRPRPGDQPLLVPPLFVHVWQSGEHVYRRGVLDRRYVADPTSRDTLERFAASTRGRVFAEGETGALAATIRAAAGDATARTTVRQYARIPLAPWFVLAGALPLAFLLWRRNL